MDTFQELIRPKDAMRLCHVTNQTLINWQQKGLISSIKTIGGQRRYKKSDIDAIITPKPSLIPEYKITLRPKTSPKQNKIQQPLSKEDIRSTWIQALQNINISY